MAVQKINVERRTIYPRFGRKRVVFDAEGTIDGVEYYVVGAESAKAARQAARDAVAFKQAHPAISADGYTLAPVDPGRFSFRVPQGGGVVFDATDRAAALDYVAESFPDREDIAPFLAQARQEIEG